jgi:2-dehydropantoate 2-reductase
MRIAMMGSGGIGGYFGARLAAAGEDVAFIARGAHLDALRLSGLRLQSPLGDLHLCNVRAAERPADIAAVDIVIFAVKLFDSEEAAAAIVPLVGSETRVVTLQNGIDSVEMLARFVPRSQVVGGTAYISVHLERPGVIVHAGGVAQPQLTLGGRGDSKIEGFRAACIRAGGMDVQTVDDVDQAIWLKFVMLSAFSGGTSLMRSGIGPILADPESRKFMEQLRDEGIAVASSAGHRMPEGYKDDVAALWQKFPPETLSSMANDLACGKPLELKWFSGRVHALGEEFGVPTPAHTAVYRALHLHAGGASFHDER